MGLMAGIVALLMMGQSIGGGLLNLFRSDLSHLLHDDLDAIQTRNIFLRLFGNAIAILGGFLGTLVAIGVATGIVQVGFHITPEKLEPDFDRLNPANGVSRLFSVASIVRGLFAILKVVVDVVAYVILRSRIGQIMTLGEDSLPAAVATAWSITLRLALFLVGILAVLGIADFIYQKQRFEATLRMSKQELKEELKREEGDPLIKIRIRQLARQRARQKMLSAVPKATVVITNPQHLAVALRYDQGKGSVAPVVVAKGAGVSAHRMIELARKHAVPVIERPPESRRFSTRL